MISQQHLMDLNKNLVKISRDKIQAEVSTRCDPNLRRVVGATNTLDALTAWMTDYVQQLASEGPHRTHHADQGIFDMNGACHHGACRAKIDSIEHGELEEIDEYEADLVVSTTSTYKDGRPHCVIVTSELKDLAGGDDDEDDEDDDDEDDEDDDDDGGDDDDADNTAWNYGLREDCIIARNSKG